MSASKHYLIALLISQRWELLLLDLLGWDLSCPTPQTILDQLLYRIEAESSEAGRVGPFNLKMIRTHSGMVLYVHIGHTCCTFKCTACI